MKDRTTRKSPSEHVEKVRPAITRSEEIIIPGLDIFPEPMDGNTDIRVHLPEMYCLQEVQSIANYSRIAAVYYCINCRVPLNIHYHSPFIFSCPKCTRKWVKSDDWEEVRPRYFPK